MVLGADFAPNTGGTRASRAQMVALQVREALGKGCREGVGGEHSAQLLCWQYECLLSTGC